MVGKNIIEHPSSANYEFLTPSSTELNLLDYPTVYKYVKINKPDFIIHAAGVVGGIQANISSPVKFLVDNVDMGRNIILAAKNNDVKNLINLASSCMYPRNANNPLSEDLILKGELEPTNEGYALAKILTTKLCEYIGQENDELSYKTVVPCNLYGRHDKFDPQHSHMVPAVIRKIDIAKNQKEKVIEIWGNGEARREFMYAADLADFIFYAISDFDGMPQNINVGFGSDFTINEYYKLIATVVGYEGSFKHDLSKPVGMQQKLIDTSRLNAYGWSHGTNLEEGIKRTYEFYKGTIKHD